MELFLTLRNFDADGNEVTKTGLHGAIVAKGWLRVSHRKLDPELLLTLPALSQAPAPALFEAGRDREGRYGNPADVDTLAGCCSNEIDFVRYGAEKTKSCRATFIAELAT